MTPATLAARQLSAVHSFVPKRLRRQGPAERVLDALLTDASAEGLTVRPRGDLVAAQLRLNPERAATFEALSARASPRRSG